MCRKTFHRCRLRTSAACFIECEEFVECDDHWYAPPSELRACRGQEVRLVLFHCAPCLALELEETELAEL